MAHERTYSECGGGCGVVWRGEHKKACLLEEVVRRSSRDVRLSTTRSLVELQAVLKERREISKEVVGNSSAARRQTRTTCGSSSRRAP